MKEVLIYLILLKPNVSNKLQVLHVYNNKYKMKCAKKAMVDFVVSLEWIL